jgi:hypothetical protein
VEKGESQSLHNSKFVASLDVVIHLLDDPNWSEKAKKIKTLKEMQQILLDFCKANGNIVQVDKDTVCVYM